MENINFQPSGEEIERALMDLGPLLGVSIKEEVPEELTDGSAPPAVSLNVSSTPDGGLAGGGGAASGCPDAAEAGDAGALGEAGEASKAGAADSLASPGASRAPPADTRCVLCHTVLTLAEGTPKLMECLHSACEPCIRAKLEEKQASSRDFLGAERVTITCPACRLQCQVANMIDQRFVLEKMALEQAGSNGAGGEQQCNSCEDTEPATSYCVDCNEFICDNCVHAHQRLKITKEHTIKSRDEALAELQAAAGGARSELDMFCSEHVQERLSLFCETCDRLTCRDCQLQHHRDHKYQFSTEMAAQARAQISALLSEVSYKRVLLGSAMKVIRDRQQLIADKKKALVHEITQTVVKSVHFKYIH
ncbi:transcription intermediary factor 1-beta [Spodoptera litura]|uniref:Transcription intermediary factor 1-beta n=1 Tax=Spodoptera litura TaxID=69820 RepID=A0A9J7IQR3_SPOLT|nr:transcription intermediary factor 1-beta [Spodoptera litura]